MSIIHLLSLKLYKILMVAEEPKYVYKIHLQNTFAKYVLPIAACKIQTLPCKRERIVIVQLLPKGISVPCPAQKTGFSGVRNVVAENVHCTSVCTDYFFICFVYNRIMRFIRRAVRCPRNRYYRRFYK